MEPSIPSSLQDTTALKVGDEGEENLVK